MSASYPPDNGLDLPEINDTKSPTSFGLLERLVICYRYNWHWRNFWRGWGNEVSLTGEFIIAGMILVCVLCRQIILVPLFPLWRLIGEPIKVAIKCTDDHAKNLKTILGI
jgi:hypothetical protein